ncbi:MAG: DUF4129 domain-containing protein [Lachnospiraceae bacterium]
MSRKVIFFTKMMHGTLIFAAVMSFFTGFFPEAQLLPMWICYGICIPILIGYLSVEFLPHLWQYLTICTATGMAIWYGVPNVYYQYLFLISSVVVFFIYLVARVREEESFFEKPHYLCMIVFFIIYVLGLYMQRENVREFVYRSAFLYMMCYAVYVNQVNFLHYLSLNKETSNFPLQQMTMVNNVMLGLFLLILMLAMIFLPASGLDKLLMQFGSLLLAGIRYLVGLLSKESEPQGEQIEETAASNETGLEGLGEQEPPPAWAEVLSNLITSLIVIAFFVAVVGGILYGSYRLYKAFDQKLSDRNGDKREFLPTQTKSEWAFDGQSDFLFKKKTLWFDFSVTASIRRLWVKGLKSHNRDKIEDTFTPRELHDATEWDSREAHFLYEKARYSNEELTKEDLEQMRQAVREGGKKA